MTLLLGFLASLFVVASAFTIRRRNLLKMSIATGILSSIQYALLGELGAVWLCCVGMTYALILLNEKRFPGARSPLSILLVIFAYTAGFFTVNDPVLSWSLLTYVAAIISATSMLVYNPLLRKYSSLLTGSIWLCYQISAQAYGQVPGEAVFLAGALCSIVYLHRAKSAGVDLATVPELMEVVLARFKAGQRRRSGHQPDEDDPP